jgi:hypothetical protein
MSKEGGGGAFWAFLAGVAVGVTVGILVAPDSGANTRKKLKEKLGQYWGVSALSSPVQKKLAPMRKLVRKPSWRVGFGPRSISAPSSSY